MPYIPQNENLVFNDEIKISNPVDNTEYVVVKMYCTINKNKSYSITFDILNEQIYLNNQVNCLQQMKDFKVYCESRTAEMGINLI